MDWNKLLISVIGCELAGGIGPIFTEAFLLAALLECPMVLFCSSPTSSGSVLRPSLIILFGS